MEAGSILGAYRIIRPLGHGGMGRVYEAEHVELRVRRALKLFGTESEHGGLLRRRFVAEGRMLADLRHPRIVRVYDFAFDPATGAPYFAMDLVLAPSGEPQTLADACACGADEERIAGWFRDICEGLAYIHSKGVVHRDVSLDNVLVGADGRAVLTDFGIAKVIGEEYRRRIDITKTVPLADGVRLNWGKGLYMAPELVVGGEATPASDAYALGVLLFRLLAGSWYTSDTHLADALAGFAYNWHEVIARLCAKAAATRLGADGIGVVPALLRRTEADDSARRRRLAPKPVYAVAGAAVLVAALAVAVRLRRTAAPERMPDASSSVYHIVDVTNHVPQTVYHIVDVTNTVYEIVPVTDRVEKIRSP